MILQIVYKFNNSVLGSIQSCIEPNMELTWNKITEHSSYKLTFPKRPDSEFNLLKITNIGQQTSSRFDTVENKNRTNQR